jgi:hypothetical protein
MKTHLFLTFICGILTTGLFAQTSKLDSGLIKKIDSMFKEDQFWRIESMKINKKEHSDYSAETIQAKWAASDSLNEFKAKAIVTQYGYPGYDVAGAKSDSFFWIIQHCDDDVPFQEHILVLMKAQIAKNNANKTNFAYLTDRVLANNHQKQIYGTQVHVDPTTHKATPMPLQYPEKVNKLRKEMGMEPLEVYLKSFQ